MNHGKYTIKDLLTNPSLEQIIIPEIQRDYVWSKENVEGLLTSIETDFKEQKKKVTEINDDLLNLMSSEIKEVFLRTLSENKVFSNIGFIYAYCGEGDVSSKYFLIDGQQRMTTMYLLLLSISIKDIKQHIFRNTYFNHNIPKIDYKVRDAAHDFLIEFVDFMLNDGNVKHVKEQYWYYTLYESDKTIQSIITNYTVIQSFIDKSDMDFSFVENNIELYYFDTAKSEQGEELYIYMNSRGESVQPNENIKAQLLEGLSDDDKHKKGKEWEFWQNLFWKNRGKNENADEGFDEFLRWIEIIGYIQNNPTLSQKEQIEFVRKTKASSRISKNFITFDRVELYFKAIERLSDKDIKYFDEKWLSGVKDLIDYVIILPALLYVEKYPNASTIEINRFMRFFYNIIKSDDVAKNPTLYASQVILLTTEFLQTGLLDISEIIQIKKEGKYNNILTVEEIFKFKLYIKPPIGSIREEIESEFWTVEDFGITNGKIQFILDCMNIDANTEIVESFDFQQFCKYSLHFRKLFKQPNDLLRRALLTFGEYILWDGYSTNLEMHRYNFGFEEEHWRVIVSHENTKPVIVSLMHKFRNKPTLNSEQYKEILEKIIDKWNETEPVHDWKVNFIKKPEYLSFCEAKRACIGEKEVYLLQSIKVTNSSSYKKVRI